MSRAITAEAALGFAIDTTKRDREREKIRVAETIVSIYARHQFDKSDGLTGTEQHLYTAALETLSKYLKPNAA